VASEMCLGIEHVFWLRASVESISRAGIQPSEGKRRGCKESQKESENIVKGLYTRRENAGRL